MQISQLQTEGLKQEYKIVVAAQDIEKKIGERLQLFGKNARISGFRPGKIPLNILKERYGQQALKETLDHACNSGVSKIIKDNSLRQATQPNVSIVNFDDGKDLELKVMVEVLPEIQLQDFAKINLEKLQVQVSDADVDEELEELIKNKVKYQPLTQDRVAKKGDRLQLEVQATAGGKPITGFEKQIHVVLGIKEKMFPGEMEAALEGAKIGEIVEVKEQFPRDFASKKTSWKISNF